MAEDDPKGHSEEEDGNASPDSGVAEDQLSRAEERLGEVLAGKWTLRRILGVGGMAAVYEAEHRNRSRVAIKMLHRELSRDQNVTRRFRQEGYAGNSIQHPGVLRVLDDDAADDGSAFLVMDLLIGSSLEDILVARPRLEPVFVAQFADEVLDILEAAHARGVIHRDVKPDNIYITATGEVKLLDFGIASVRQSSKNTTMGSFMGTPAFCPPEQARGRWSEVDQRSDLWALGATMFTALTGHAVHEGETITEVLALAVQSRAPLVSDIAPDAHPELGKLIDRALQYEKSERFQTAAEFREALTALEGVLPPSEKGLEVLVDRTTISETSGTLLRRPKRSFRTPDRVGSSPELRAGGAAANKREPTRIGLGPVAPSLPAASARGGADPRATAMPTTISGHPTPKKRDLRPWLVAALAAGLTAAIGWSNLSSRDQEPIANEPSEAAQADPEPTETNLTDRAPSEALPSGDPSEAREGPIPAQGSETAAPQAPPPEDVSPSNTRPGAKPGSPTTAGGTQDPLAREATNPPAAPTHQTPTHQAPTHQTPTRGSSTSPPSSATSDQRSPVSSGHTSSPPATGSPGTTAPADPDSEATTPKRNEALRTRY